MGIAGNDADAARQESQSQYGEHASAEDLIKAHDFAFDAGMQAALQKPVDGAATEALDVESIQPKFDGEIVSAAVRGGRLIVVEEANGQLLKWSDPDFVKGGRAQQAVRQAAASVGGDPDKEGGAPEAKGTAAGSGSGGTGAPLTAPPGSQASTQAGTTQGGSQGAQGDKAPDGVTVPVIKDKLDSLQIQPASDVRTKDALWALLPDDAKQELADSAA